MEKINPTTPDITQENVDRLAKLFPSVTTEVTDIDGNTHAAIDFDALRELLGDVAEGQRERYQFTWPGKREAKSLARTPCDKTMRPERSRSVNWDTTENLYIEGDNLEALKLMRETYAGKIKLIYIDPPYNTGHDFIYDDDFAQTRTDYEATSGDFDEDGGRLVANLASNGRFHSDWCSMIYPRLQLARDLLTSDGAIFISIDDVEVDNLKKICNEIYGADNFYAHIVWQKRTSPDARFNLGAAHDHILVFAKSHDAFKVSLNKEELSSDRQGQYKNPDNDPRGPWASVDITGQTGHATGSQFYEITTPNGTRMRPPEGRCWALAESTFLQLARDNRIWFGDDGGSRPRQKKFLSESEGGNAWTWWTNTDVGHNQEGAKDVKKLFGTSDFFTNPKPVRLIERIIHLASKPDSIVCDFFSGSATTAESVMRQNLSDGGCRRFILVQLPEVTNEGDEAFKQGYRTLCELGEERIRRAGEAVKKTAVKAIEQPKLGEPQTTIPDVGFRVLRIDTSNFRDTYREPGEQDQSTIYDFVDNLKEDRTPEDLLFQVLPSFRIPYSANIEEFDVNGSRCFNVNDGQLIACFDTQVSTDVIERIAQERPVYAVFRDASLADDSAAANFEELFKTYSPDTIRRVI